ncbi:hypothetical protein BCEN4_1140023 [Burkholderia cenocepacia]|nr:hypothetical protein BCEN4_1140023 [Burkholderia cenocepacia]
MLRVMSARPSAGGRGGPAGRRSPLRTAGSGVHQSGARFKAHPERSAFRSPAAPGLGEQ